MKVQRSARLGYVTVFDRFYKLPAYIISKHEDLLGSKVWVDDDGVCYWDDPEHGVYTVKRVSIFWPGRHNWLCYADLEEKGRARNVIRRSH